MHKVPLNAPKELNHEDQEDLKEKPQFFEVFAVIFPLR
jgi:hypothetical protein